MEKYPAARISSRGKTNNRTSKLWLFVRNFLQHPMAIGWVLPSSRFLVDELLEAVPWPRARVLVEYGPGVGAFTSEILRRMRPDATLVALEINKDFFDFLRQSISDPRLQLFCESATHVDTVLARLGLDGADCVISGIPFKTIAQPEREEIVRQTYAVLRPRGRFLVYQFSSTIGPCLQNVFGRVTRKFEWLNLLPARLFYCVR